MSAPLRRSAEALGVLGWEGRHAEWIAFACLHGGAFTRPQLCAYLGIARAQARRIVGKMLEQKIATEERIEGRRVCRIIGCGVYRRLGLPRVRASRDASEELVLRRVLTLDYVLEHPGLPWLATRAERVSAFEALGIARELLPARRWRRRAGARVYHFQHDFPIALDTGRALFVFIDPGYATGDALRRWGKAHRRLWEALRAGERSVEVVAVARTVRELRRAQGTLARWSLPLASASAEAGGPARVEIARIERAVLEDDEEAIREYGDLQGCLMRITELAELERNSRPRVAIDGFDTWRSVRLPGGWS